MAFKLVCMILGQSTIVIYTKFTFFKLNEKSSGKYLEQGTIMSSVSPDRENQKNTFFSTLNPLTAGAAYIWVLICISTLSTTF